jgi:hypothetical protein
MTLSIQPGRSLDGPHCAQGRSRRVACMMLPMIILWLVSGSLYAGPSGKPTLDPNRPFLFMCGGTGQSCCPNLSRGGFPAGPPNCDSGLGCDISANRCVAACGEPGQPCCDGPHTVAPRGGASPSGPFRDRLKPMCLAGACSTATHRCKPCGQIAGEFCCLPDAAIGVSTCPVKGLACKTFTEDPRNQGVCVVCGHGGEPPCASKDPCKEGFAARDDTCVACGGDQQPLCDTGTGCFPHFKVWYDICIPCGGIGQIVCPPSPPFNRNAPKVCRLTTKAMPIA